MSTTPLLESTTSSESAGLEDVPETNVSEGTLFSDSNLLKASTDVTASRVGTDFQVDKFPDAGTYKRQCPEDKAFYETAWDPKLAEDNGLIDFVHMNCPPNKKEFAISLLHELKYDASDRFWDALQTICPLDDSTWTEDEKCIFLRLMTETKHDVSKIAQRLGKSVSNCLTVHYSNTGCNVRMTRSARRRLPLGSAPLVSAILPFKKVYQGELRINTRKLNNGKAQLMTSTRREARENVNDTNPQNMKLPPRVLTENTSLEKTNNFLDEETKIYTHKDVSHLSVTVKNEQKGCCPDTFISKINVASKESSSTNERLIDPTDNHIVPDLHLSSGKDSPNPIEATSEKKLGTSSPVEKNIPTNDNGLRRVTRSTSRRANGQSLPANFAFIPVEDNSLEKEEGAIMRQTRSSVKRETVETFEQETPNKRSRTNVSKVEPIRQRKNPTVVWNAHFASLLEFKNKNNHCLIPKIHPENQPLSSWVFRQRAEYKKREQNNGESSYLTDERIKKLEENGFAWRTKCTKEQSALEKKKRSGPENKRWEALFALLVSYKEVHGNCLVPKIYKENQTLSAWVFKQRAQMKLRNEGRESRLTDDRVEKLNSLGFVWDAKRDKEWRELDQLKKQKQADILWDQHYRSLVSFKKGCGHTRVPKNYKLNQPLSAWVFRQRSHHRSYLKKKPNSLTERRRRKLMQIGFEFEIL